MTVRRLIVVSAALAVALTVGLPIGSGTTVPGVVYPVKTLVTDTHISISKDKFTRHGVTRWPRGAQIRFEITNKGSKRYVLQIWSERTLPMRPHGGHDSMLVNWNYRGKYLYRTLVNGKPAGPKGWILIF
jgi:hypothetical protein